MHLAVRAKPHVGQEPQDEAHRGRAHRTSIPVAAFFYGSYMDPQVLKRFGATPGKPRPARLRRWHLTFTPHANLVPDPEGLVHGFVFELPHEELERLYGSSGFVTTYKPVPVLVQTERGDLAALTFVEHAAEAAPEPEYLEAFLEICGRLGLPEGYIRGIEGEAQHLAALAA